MSDLRGQLKKCLETTLWAQYTDKPSTTGTVYSKVRAATKSLAWPAAILVSLALLISGVMQDTTMVKTFVPKVASLFIRDDKAKENVLCAQICQHFHKYDSASMFYDQAAAALPPNSLAQFRMQMRSAEILRNGNIIGSDKKYIRLTSNIAHFLATYRSPPLSTDNARALIRIAEKAMRAIPIKTIETDVYTLPNDLSYIASVSSSFNMRNQAKMFYSIALDKAQEQHHRTGKYYSNISEMHKDMGLLYLVEAATVKDPAHKHKWLTLAVSQFAAALKFRNSANRTDPHSCRLSLCAAICRLRMGEESRGLAEVEDSRKELIKRMQLTNQMSEAEALASYEYYEYLTIGTSLLAPTNMAMSIDFSSKAAEMAEDNLRHSRVLATGENWTATALSSRFSLGGLYCFAGKFVLACDTLGPALDTWAQTKPPKADDPVAARSAYMVSLLRKDDAHTTEDFDAAMEQYARLLNKPDPSNCKKACATMLTTRSREINGRTDIDAQARALLLKHPDWETATTTSSPAR